MDLAVVDRARRPHERPACCRGRLGSSATSNMPATTWTAVASATRAQVAPRTGRPAARRRGRASDPAGRSRGRRPRAARRGRPPAPASARRARSSSGSARSPTGRASHAQLDESAMAWRHATSVSGARRLRSGSDRGCEDARRGRRPRPPVASAAWSSPAATAARMDGCRQGVRWRLARPDAAGVRRRRARSTADDGRGRATGRAHRSRPVTFVREDPPRRRSGGGLLTGVRRAPARTAPRRRCWQWTCRRVTASTMRRLREAAVEPRTARCWSTSDDRSQYLARGLPTRPGWTAVRPDPAGQHGMALHRLLARPRPRRGCRRPAEEAVDVDSWADLAATCVH